MSNFTENASVSMPAQLPSSNVQLYVVMGYLSFLSVMGTVGNALVLYVFSQKKDKLVSTLFILVLAFVDCITCSLVIPWTIYMEYVYFEVRYDAVCKVYQFMITSNIPFSAMIMVAIAVDRYFCICHPFLQALNIQRAKLVSFFLGLLAVMIGVCVTLMFGVYEVVEIPPMVQVNTTHWILDFPENITDSRVSVYEYIESSPYYIDYESWKRQNYMYIDSTEAMAVQTEAADFNTTNKKTMITFSGVCKANDIILSQTFLYYYSRLYNSLYLVCLVIVILLYTLIYKSVLSRRTKRQKQKSKSLPLIQMSNEQTLECTTEDTILTMDTEANGDSKQQSKNGPASKDKGAALKGRENKLREREKQKRKSMKKDTHHMANLKTAMMLFVVTVVFIVTFCPAYLMINTIVPYNLVVFYLYFANNVANPVIYSFMNKNFRDDMKKLFCRRR